MAKFGKSLLALTIIGAAAAGTYYYLKKQDGNVPADMDEDDDFDNLDADVEDGAASAKKRSYVNINFNTVEEKAKVAAEKAADFAFGLKDSEVDDQTKKIIDFELECISKKDTTEHYMDEV